MYPDLTPEKNKITEIISNFDIVSKEKDRKSFLERGFEDDLGRMLEKPLAQYVQESQLCGALSSLACIIGDLQLHRDSSNERMFKLEILVLSRFMKLDLAAINALLIFPKQVDYYRKNIMALGGQENNFSTLIDLLDKCKTQIGSRTLRRWVRQPLQDDVEINRRLNIVEYLSQQNDLRNFLQTQFLQKICDLDKLYSKFYRVASNKRHNANLYDCIKVLQIVNSLEMLGKYILDHNQEDLIAQREFLEPLGELINNFGTLTSMIEKSIDLQRAHNDNEYHVRPMFSPTLEQLALNMKTVLSQIEEHRIECAQELGVDAKLVESSTHTFLFEGKKKELDDAFRTMQNRKYRQISVKKGCIAFTTGIMQSLIAEYNNIRESYEIEQRSVVQTILRVVSSYYIYLERASFMISEYDVLANFASLVASSPSPYVKPNIRKENKSINLIESRHPCLEVINNNCVANDCFMDSENSRFHIITGPNMGGKSTFIRQTAICVLLAHIGCFVPCTSAEIPIIDAIITRVGASDMQLRGISTFMSEMLEASCMLSTSTERSLIIIDELGRGTSTSEGFGIAWAISEYIASKLKSYCLFATHFHEMRKLQDEVGGVTNYYVSCIAIENKLTMQFKVKKGYAERSYGLFVAETLDFPAEIIDDAANKLLELESYSSGSTKSERISDQLNKNSQSNDVDDIHVLSRNSSWAQKGNVVEIAAQYNEKIKYATKREQKRDLLDELKHQIYSVLKS